MSLSFFSSTDILFTGLLALLAAASMIAGGVILIGHSVRMGREALKQRVNLLHLRSATGKTGMTARAMQAEETELVRRPFHGMPERERREIVRQLSRLRIPHHYARAIFNGSRFFMAAGIGVLVFFVAVKFSFYEKHSLLSAAIVIVMAVIGWSLPVVLIRRLAESRAMASAAGLPDALELLVVCAEAGLALEDGIDRVVIELGHSQPKLAEELFLTSADLKILPSREQALTNLAERIDTPGVRSVVTTLCQTLRYGTPLAQAMRVAAADMRNESLIHLEERANRLPVLMTIPMMLLIMPTIFLIVGGPAALRLMDHFMH